MNGITINGLESKMLAPRNSEELQIEAEQRNDGMMSLTKDVRVP